MANVNRNYCKPDAEMKPVFAPAAFHFNGKDYWHPEKEDFALVGYLPLVDELPPDFDTPDGQHYERTGEIVRDGDGYVWAYALVDTPPPPPRRWTKLAIETALAQADMLDAMDAFLAQTTIVGKLTAARAFERCDYIEEGYPDAEKWSALLDGAATALGKTREEIDAFLGAIPTEG